MEFGDTDEPLLSILVQATPPTSNSILIQNLEFQDPVSNSMGSALQFLLQGISDAPPSGHTIAHDFRLNINPRVVKVGPSSTTTEPKGSAAL